MALVLWSGGCDSTLVLYDLACAYKKEKIKDGWQGPRALSIQHPQIIASPQMANARKRLLKSLDDRGFIVGDTIVSISQKGAFGVEPSKDGLSQPIIWVAIGLSYLGESEDLYCGYIRGDDIWHYRSELVQAFDYLKVVAGKTGRLIFPLEWETKSAVIGRLKKARLYRSCWYCETPKKNKPCRNCVPCRTHRSAKTT